VKNAQTVAHQAHKRSIGLTAATALVVGNMIGSGVFLLPASLSGYGGLALVAWAFTCGGALLLALVFARFSTRMPKVGGPYAYVQHAFGRVPGFFVAWGYWIAVWVGNAAIAIATVGYLGYFVPGIKGHALTGALIAVGLVWAATAINLRGLREVGLVAIVTTTLKLIPLVGVAVVGLFFLGDGDFPEFNPTGGSAYSGVSAAATLTLWAFIGMESATVPADDVQDPQRTIPRATVIGVSMAAAIYILGTFVVMTLVPADQLKDSTAPFADAAKIMVGPAGGAIVAAGGLISCLGALNGWVMLQGQVPYAAAKDGLFPKVFGRANKQGVPVVAVVVSSALMTALILLTANDSLVKQFDKAILIATLSSLIPYGLTAMAQLEIMSAERGPRGDMLKHGVIAMLALAYSVWAIIGSGGETVRYGLLALAAGMPVYLWLEFKRQGEVPMAE
jgi:APA family basic amino acid/polyamine antiporter